jgi:hypothetical protein
LLTAAELQNALSSAWSNVSLGVISPAVPVASIVGIVGIQGVPSAPPAYHDVAADATIFEHEPRVATPPRMLAKLNHFVQHLTVNARGSYAPISTSDAVEVELAPVASSQMDSSPQVHNIIAPGPRILLEPCRIGDKSSITRGQTPAVTVSNVSHPPIAARSRSPVTSVTFSADLLPQVPQSVPHSPGASLNSELSRLLPA